MKKLLALLMAFVMLLSFAACGGNDEPETDTTAAPDSVETTLPATEPAAAEVAIEEEIEGFGEAVLSNSYIEFVIPEGFGYYIDDANQQEGDSIFQVILDIKNENGDKIGEFTINNRGGLESAEEYANVVVDQYKDSESTKVTVVGSAKYGSFDVTHLSLDLGYQVDNRFYGYYQIPDGNAEYRNVNFELELMGYYFQDVEFPKAECEAIMNSIVIK